ncbi:Transcriptional activator [Dinochytrium kinnereticum]|nr:Transcriptional activator [Dinochytrium kinnereticum]
MSVQMDQARNVQNAPSGSVAAVAQRFVNQQQQQQHQQQQPYPPPPLTIQMMTQMLGGPAAAMNMPGSSSAPPSAAPRPSMFPPVEEAPLYVNAKQYHRILKRRETRQKLEAIQKASKKDKAGYVHESRHRHAMRRPRGPGGRFLSSAERAALEAAEAAKASSLTTDDQEEQQERDLRAIAGLHMAMNGHAPPRELMSAPPPSS